MLEEMLINVQCNCPIVHNITNYVSANDCANLLLAVGASPIMADCLFEVEEITSACDGLVLNMGILNEQKLEAMILAGKKANFLGHPVVLDPVGVGTSSFRAQGLKKILNEVHVSVVRGNLSEIKFLANLTEYSRGVDLNQEDKDEDLKNIISYIKDLSYKLNSILVISGSTDLIVDHDRVCFVQNGNEMLSRVTGTGCQLSSLLGAMISANPNSIFESCIAGVCMMGIAGEKAYEHSQGTASFKVNVMDVISCMTPEDLRQGARYEIQ